MEAIKLFGKATCHKSQFYKQWLTDNHIPYDFYELKNNEMNQDFLTLFYANGQQHFPTIVIGNKTLRNPEVSKIGRQLIKASVEQLEEGYSEVSFNQQKYAVTKKVFNDGKSVKVYAKNLKDGDFISFNLYRTKAGLQLKPCEMPEHKVIDFLKQYEHKQYGTNSSALQMGKMYKHFGTMDISRVV
jgi:peptide-methionine (S)-S-oxide reductase